MKHYISFIIGLVYALNISAQTRTSVTASVTIVDVAGTSFSSHVDSVNDSLSQTAFAEEGMKIVNADQTVNLGKLSFISTAAYSLTLPAEPINLSRMSGNELLTIQSLEVINSKDDSNSVNIIATCLPALKQAPGLYLSAAQVDIVIDYN